MYESLCCKSVTASGTCGLHQYFSEKERGIGKMWVMVTGITEIEDALDAYNLGVDAVGLLVGQVHASKSPFISPEVAKSITKSLRQQEKGSSHPLW